MATVIRVERHRSHSMGKWAESTVYVNCGKEGYLSFPVRARRCKFCKAEMTETPGNMTSMNNKLISKCLDAPKRRTKWDHWFAKLKTGDKVTLIIGARTVVGIVGRQPKNPKIKTIKYRMPDGRRNGVNLERWCEVKAKVIPFGYELKYSGERGYTITNKKLEGQNYPFWKPEEGKEYMIRFLDVDYPSMSENP